MRGMTTDVSRRHALLAGLGVATFGGALFNAPRVIAASRSALPAAALATLRAYADTLVPGAAAAGVTDFVSAMLAADDPMLFYKYLDVPLPPTEFYTRSLTALDALALQAKKRRYPELNRADMKAVAGMLLDPKLDWGGPPAFLFYLTVKNDGLDVTYGSTAAYDRLDVPYMAHILPPSVW